jgi:hypothetical protein
MRSVLPLILGIGPFMSAQGFSSAPAGAVGSGLVGSAAVTSGSAGAAGSACAAGTAGAAGIAGGTSGAAAGLAGIGSVGAVGITHATAVAGLAVASVVAALGVQAVELSIGQPAQAPPEMNSVVPGDLNPSGDSAGTVAEPSLDSSVPASTTEEAVVTTVETEGLLTPTPDPTASGELGVVSGSVGVPVTTDVYAPTPVSTTGSTETPAPASGSTAEPGTTYGSPSATPGPEPFGADSPASEHAQGTENWPGSDDGTSGPGRSDSAPGKTKSSQPADGDGGSATGGQPSAPPAPSQAADPGTKGPGNSARPEHAGGGRHKKM